MFKLWGGQITKRFLTLFVVIVLCAVCWVTLAACSKNGDDTPPFTIIGDWWGSNDFDLGNGVIKTMTVEITIGNGVATLLIKNTYSNNTPDIGLGKFWGYFGHIDDTTLFFTAQAINAGSIDSWIAINWHNVGIPSIIEIVNQKLVYDGVTLSKV